MTASDVKQNKFDTLRLYFGEDLKLSDKIIVSQPSIGDILEMGEQNFFSSLYVFIGNPTTFRLQLWDLGIDWNKIEDFDLFCSLITNVDKDFTKLIFKDLNFSTFQYCKRTKNDAIENVLYCPEQDIVLDEEMYKTMREYLQTIFKIYPKVEKAKGKITKEWIIQEERDKAEAAKKNITNDSMLFPLVSSCINHPGFKYKLNELKDVGIYEFMDCVSRLQIYESSTALLKGVYSGFVDASKISKDNFNFMREIK